MDDDDAPKKPQTADPSIALFLSLYLLLLAFFILLNTLSTLEDVRAKKVMDSLISAFSSLIPPSTKPVPFTSQQGEAFTPLQAMERLGNLFTTAIPVAQVNVVQPGRQMYIRMHPEALFETDSATIRPGLGPFLERLAAALAARPPGYRNELEFLINTPYEPGNKLPETPSLEVARAGNFARQLLERGAPKSVLRVGLKPSPVKNLEFFFYLHADDEPVLDFSDLARRRG
ncbi:MAG: hypothetical protein HY521_03650 [Proteobacteria bacterium]|nr:hypothetical protein [Pseudomonadota bacterium]